MKVITFWFAFGVLPVTLFCQKGKLRPSSEAILGLESINQQPTILYFFSEWCLPCDWVEENTLSVDSIKSRIYPTYTIFKMDVENQNNINIIKHFGVKSLPTIIILDSFGNPLEKIESSLNAHQLAKLLAKTNAIVHNQNKNNRIDKPSYVINPMGKISRPPLVPKKETSSEKIMEAPDQYKEHPSNENLDYLFENLPPSDIYSGNVAPRSTQLYTISLGVYYDYQKAISNINAIESKLKQKILIKTNGIDDDMSYHLHFGKFQTFAKAQKRLNAFKKMGVKGTIEALMN